MEQPSVGAHYPRSTGEFQAWFRTDADCLDYLDWVRPAHGTGTGEQVTEHVAGQSEDPPEHRRGLGADHLARQRVQRPDPAHDRIGSAGTAGQLAAAADQRGGPGGSLWPRLRPPPVRHPMLLTCWNSVNRLRTSSRSARRPISPDCLTRLRYCQVKNALSMPTRRDISFAPVLVAAVRTSEKSQGGDRF